MIAAVRKLIASLLLAAGIAISGPAAAAADYELIGSFGGPGAGPGEFSLPLGVAVDRDGVIYVADSFNHRLQRFGADGSFLGEIGSEGPDPGQFNTPYDVAVDRGGRLLVADTGNRRIQRIDPATGAAEAVFGEAGVGPGLLAAPTGIAASGNDVLVVDRDNANVQRYGADGALLDEWGVEGSAPGQFTTPLDVSAGPGGNVFVADTVNDRVQRFSAAGEYETEWSQGLAEPQGIDVDPEGTVLVADSGNDRIMLFDIAGGPLGGFGVSGSGPGEFDLPRGLATDCWGRVFVTDVFNNRVQVFADPERVARGDRCSPGLDDLIQQLAGVGLPGHAAGAAIAKLKAVGEALDRGRLRCACHSLRAASQMLDGLGRRHGSPELDAVRAAIGAFAVSVGCESATEAHAQRHGHDHRSMRSKRS